MRECDTWWELGRPLRLCLADAEPQSDCRSAFPHMDPPRSNLGLALLVPPLPEWVSECTWATT